MLHIDRHINLWGYFGAAAFGGAMMAAPEYLHLNPWLASFVFIGGLLVFAVSTIIMLGLALYGRERRPSVIGPFLVIGTGAVLVAGGVIWLYLSSRHPNDQQIATVLAPTNIDIPIVKPETTMPKKQERIFVGESITPTYLMSLYHVPGRTSAQAAKDIEPFIGKWIKISGIMNDVSVNMEFPKLGYLTLEKDPNIVNTSWLYWAALHIRFRDAWVDRILILMQGDKVTIIGQIDSIESHVMKLDNCELVENDIK